MDYKTSSKQKIQSPALEHSWKNAIDKGKINRGNIQVNIDFLEQTNLIHSGQRVLELGCGAGNLASYMYEKGVSIVASDIAQAAIDHAREHHPNIEFRTHSADDLPYENNSFDVVMSFDVLEHLPDVNLHLHEVWRALKPGGYYLFQTPNKLSNATFETLKCRSMKWKKYHPSLHFYGQLKRRLNRNGFSFQCIKMNTMNEFAINKFKKVGIPGWLFAWIDFRHLPFTLQTNFYVIAQKTDAA